MVLIHLQKAFDTIDHEIFLQKRKAIRFSKETLQWFRSYLPDQIFLINLESKLSDFGKISCGVPQGFILGPLFFLIYASDMGQAVRWFLLLHADDSCILYQHKEEDEVEKQFNKDFENTCDWFVDKLILFASKRRSKNARQLNIRYSHIIIKQHSQVRYLWCMLDETMSGEPMALKVINKVNGTLKFLYRKIEISQNSFTEYSAMVLFCHILFMCVQLGTPISIKKWKRKYK